jgi:Uma2 family endonuclease
MTATIAIAPQFQTSLRLMTEEEYLAFEIPSEVRHEFINGKIIDMPGELLHNNKISKRLTRLLDPQIEANGYESYLLVARVRISNAVENIARYRYPDVVITGENEPDTRMVQFPSLIAEVLSPSTEWMDRGKKMREYKSIPSLQYYLLVSADEIQVEVYRRSGKSWLVDDYSNADDVIDLSQIGATLRVGDIYDGVVLPTI